MGEGSETADTEERIAILQHQLHCLEEGRNVDDLRNDITLTPDQIRAEIDRILQKFGEREGLGSNV